MKKNRDSSGSTVTRLGVGRPGLDSRNEKEFSVLHHIQTGPGAHPTSYPMGTGGFFARDKAVGE
jgi:hypothetical protein